MKKLLCNFLCVVLIVFCFIIFYNGHKIAAEDELANISKDNYIIYDIKLNNKYFANNNYTYNYLLVDTKSKLADKSIFLADNIDVQKVYIDLKNLNYAPSKNLTIFSILNLDDYSKGNEVNIKILLNGKLYPIEDIVLNNSNETYNFIFVGNELYNDKNIYQGQIINLVSDPVALVSDKTFISGYDRLKNTKFKVNLNLLNKSDNKFKLVIFKNGIGG